MKLGIGLAIDIPITDWISYCVSLPQMLHCAYLKGRQYNLFHRMDFTSYQLFIMKLRPDALCWRHGDSEGFGLSDGE